MRAGLLSSPEIIDVLNEHYICSWALPPVVEELAINSVSEQEQILARELFDNFRPLVELCVVTPTGIVERRLAVNEELLDLSNEYEEREAILLDFLDQSLPEK